MIDTTNHPPLWRVMFDAYDTFPPAPVDADNDWTDRHGYAAEIRALRDWLVPEEKEPRIYEHCDRDVLVEWHLWNQCQELRALLTAEADRAECGEVEA